ncbi:hypothetical protein BO443_10496 [Burkholderia orbicola]
MSPRPHGQDGRLARAPLADGRAGRGVVFGSILSQKGLAGRGGQKTVAGSAARPDAGNRP